MARISENIFVQDAGTSLLEVLGEADALPAPLNSNDPRLIHIINPHCAPDRLAEQRLTFETLRIARTHYGNRLDGGSSCNVEIVAAAFEEDRAFAEEIGIYAPLARSALDLASFKVPRKLPLLFDVLAAGAKAASKGDFLIYTNTDICLVPDFYTAITRFLQLGFDAITVNRRTVEAFRTDPKLLPLMTASLGSIHPGFDCFVFPAVWLDAFVPTSVLIGIPGVARGLLYNMAAHAKKMLMLNSVHLTFHLGNDQPWSNRDLLDYREFNFAQTRGIFAHLPERQKVNLRAFCIEYGEAAKISGIRRPFFSRKSRP